MSNDAARRKEKNMKKTISLFLLGVMMLSLVCVPVCAEEAAPAEDASASLVQLMTEFAENLQPGTAGASLKAVKEAVRLMDWGTKTEISNDQIKAACEDFFADKDEEFRVKYREQMEQLDETYQLLLTEGQEELLESAGCTGTDYPWGGKPIDAVERFLAILGLRVYTGDYTEFLETYYTAIKEKWSKEQVAMAGMNIVIRDWFESPDALDSIGFTVRDINHDGIEELLVGFMNDTEGITDLYTVCDGNRMLVIQGGQYNVTYYVCHDGTICRYTYRGETDKGYHYFNLRNGWLIPFGSLICNASYNPGNIWYIGTEDDWDISKCSYYPPDMVIQMVQSYEANYVDNDYTPFSQLHN